VALKIFGYKRNELIGQNIIKIIPSPFAESHDMFLRRYLDTGFAKVVDRPRQVLGLQRDGYLLPFILCVKHIVDPNGTQSFLGVSKPVKESPSSGFIILESDLKIKHFSRAVGELFGTKPIHHHHHHHQSYIDPNQPPLTLTQWIPQAVPEKMMEITARGGMKLQMNIGGRVIDLVLAGDSISMAGLSLYILKIKFKAARVERSEPQSDRNPFDTPIDGVPDNTGVSTCPFAGSGMPMPPGHRRPSALIQLPEEDDDEDVEASDEAMPMNFSPDSSEQNLSSGQPSSSVANNSNSSGINTPNNAAKKKLSVQSPQATFKRNANMSRGGDIDSISSDGERNSQTKNPLKLKKQTSITGRDRRANRQKTASDEASDRGSVSSRGSRATSQSSSYVKRVISMKNEASNNRLKWLHYSFVFCLLVLIALAIQEHIMYRALYESVQIDMDGIYNHADMTFRMARISDSVRSIDLIRSNASWWTQNSTSLDTVAVAKATLLEDTTFLMNHHIAFSQNDGFLRLVREDGSMSEDLTSLEALLATLASAKFVQAAPIDDPSLPSQIQLVLNNAPTVILTFINSTIQAHLGAFETKTTAVPISFIAKASVGPVVCLVVVLALITPLYVRMEETREHFLRMFYDIPKEVVKGIYESHYQRLLSTNDEDDEDEEFSAKFAIDKMLASDGGANEIGGSDTRNSDNFNFIFTQKFTENDGGGTTGGKKASLRFWNFMEIHRRDQHKLSLKTLLIFALTSLFFFVSGGLTYSFLQRSRNLGDSVYWSSQRSIYMREATFLLREKYIDLARSLSSPVVTPHITASPLAKAQYRMVQQLVDSLSWVEKAILYGDPIARLSGVTKLPDDDFKLQIETMNACVDDLPSDCRTYRDGLMTRGLRAGLNWYMRSASLALSSIDSNSTTAGTVTYANGGMKYIDNQISDIRLLERSYLTPAVKIVTKANIQPITEYVSWFYNFHVSFTVAFVLALALVDVLVIRPLMKALGEDLRRTAALVYMLPSEVLTTVPSFKRWASTRGDSRKYHDRKGPESTSKEKDVGKKSELKSLKVEEVTSDSETSPAP
jgi:PAS domain S-box-containing protein